MLGDRTEALSALHASDLGVVQRSQYSYLYVFRDRRKLLMDVRGKCETTHLSQLWCFDHLLSVLLVKKSCKEQTKRQTKKHCLPCFGHFCNLTWSGSIESGAQWELLL